MSELFEQAKLITKTYQGLHRYVGQSNLKPCPFCGAAPDLANYNDHQSGGVLYYVECRNYPACNITVSTQPSHDPGSAVRMWNGRRNELSPLP